MKILVCTYEYPPQASGIGTFVYTMVRQFQKKGNKCTVCSISGNSNIKLGSFGNLRRFGGIEIYRYWKKVSAYFKKGEYDIVWLQSPILVKKLPFSKAVVTIHTTYKGMFEINNNIAAPIYKRIFYWIMWHIETNCLHSLNDYKYSYISSKVADELMDMGINIEGMQLLPTAVDTAKFIPIADKNIMRIRLGIPEDSTVLLYVGRLTSVKRLHLVLKTFNELEKITDHVYLIIAGDGELRAKLESIAAGSNVKFIGNVAHDELPRLYGCSDFFIMLSEYEGQPVALLEAMATGLPPILSNLPVFQYIVDQAKGGLILKSIRPEIAAEYICEYITNEKTKHDAENVRKYIVNNLSVDACAQKYLDLFAGI